MDHSENRLQNRGMFGVLMASHSERPVSGHRKATVFDVRTVSGTRTRGSLFLYWENGQRVWLLPEDVTSGRCLFKDRTGPLKSSLPGRKKDISSLALIANAQRAARAQKPGVTFPHNQGTVGGEAGSLWITALCHSLL